MGCPPVPPDQKDVSYANCGGFPTDAATYKFVSYTNCAGFPTDPNLLYVTVNGGPCACCTPGPCAPIYPNPSATFCATVNGTQFTLSNVGGGCQGPWEGCSADGMYKISGFVPTMNCCAPVGQFEVDPTLACGGGTPVGCVSPDMGAAAVLVCDCASGTYYDHTFNFAGAGCTGSYHVVITYGGCGSSPCTCQWWCVGNNTFHPPPPGSPPAPLACIQACDQPYNEYCQAAIGGPYLTSVACSSACTGSLMMPSPFGGAVTLTTAPVATGAPPAAGATTAGPGSELKAILSALGFPTCGACAAFAAQMDGWGVDGCRARRAEIVAWLRKQQARTGWLRKLVGGVKAVAAGIPVDPLDPAGSLLDEALRRASDRQNPPP